ncbi:MAG TPA: FxLYD domain-containing protein [Terriglobales bacterium]|nr:FxLYD domain-containing protein [Terriglobales bacterium]
MATNPKLPDYPDIPPRKSADDHAKVQVIKKSKFPWPIVALIIGAAILIAIIALLPRAPHVTQAPTAAQVPQQPTVDQIQLTNMKLSTSPVGGALYLTGLLHNTGSTAITGVQVQVQFLGRNGPVLETVTRPVEGLVGGTSDQAQNLTQAPIKPNESRPIRIYVEHVPSGWNHQLPKLTVTAVTGTTA